jgi:hypothetical protein
MARSGMGLSCAVEPGTPRGGFAPSGPGTGAGWTKIRLGTPGFAGRLNRSTRQDRREKYRQRGRIVARP